VSGIVGLSNFPGKALADAPACRLRDCTSTEPESPSDRKQRLADLGDSPQDRPGFERDKQIVQRAERYGLRATGSRLRSVDDQAVQLRREEQTSPSTIDPAVA